MKPFILSIMSSFIIATPLSSQIRLPNLLSDHAVLQRDQPARIWGWARPGETLQVNIHAQQVSTTADLKGHWEVFLKPESAGGPYTLEVIGSSKITLQDVVFGDVYMASGQSNMGYSFAGIQDSVMPHAKEVLAAANAPNLRLLRIPKSFVDTPQQDQPTQWARSTPSSAAEFSLIGYLFGRAISDREHIPVGIIQAAYGGTPAEAWVSAGSLAGDPRLQKSLAQWKTQVNVNTLPADAKPQPQQIESAPGEQGEQTRGAATQHHPGNWAASALFNAMIAPATQYTIKGVIWYQGESSTDPTRAPVYGEVFRLLITDWRRQWGEQEMPFIFVQISSFMAPPKMSWGTIRDAQRRTLEVPDTAMAVTYDVGFPHNPHPPLKQQITDRIVLAARVLIYGEKIEPSGPLFQEARKDGNSMTVLFTHAANLQATGGLVKGFEVAGADGQFVPATATINKNSVVVGSPSVPDPVYVRYAWANYTDANLYNGAGLPAATFTSAKPIR